MNRIKIGLNISVCIVALMFVTSCSAAAQLAGSEWRPAEIGDIEIPAASEMFVRFGGGGRLAGHGGCNRFTGSYKLTGDAIELGPLAVTRMACLKPVMDHEARFLRALESAARFARDRAKLSLADEAGKPVMRLIQTDAD